MAKTAKQISENAAARKAKREAAKERAAEEQTAHQTSETDKGVQAQSVSSPPGVAVGPTGSQQVDPVVQKHIDDQQRALDEQKAQAEAAAKLDENGKAKEPTKAEKARTAALEQKAEAERQAEVAKRVEELSADHERALAQRVYYPDIAVGPIPDDKPKKD